MTVDESTWSSFVASHSEANFLQSLEWAEANRQIGHEIVRGGIKKGGQLVAGWQGIVKSAKRGRYLEVPGGPLMDWANKSLLGEVVDQLQKAALNHRCVFVRIRPQEVDSDGLRNQLSEAGFRRAPFHLHAEHTNILDLASSEEDMLKKMRRQTRYEVRQAQKKGVEVTWQSGQAAVDEFFAVQAETAKRQGFVPPSQEFLTAQMAAFGDKARIYRAAKDDNLLSLALVLFSGDEAVYFEAASTADSRRFSSAYALLWQAIRDAKAMGMRRYNFWGIAYSDDPKHRYAGVTTFKRGFGGEDVTYTPAHDLVISRAGYLKNWLVETFRKKRRKL